MVLEGHLVDPYTGQQVRFSRARPAEVQVDYVYPLAAAWDFGAHAWSAAERARFANDPRNLVATTAAVNADKGASTPAQWEPAGAGRRCERAQRYLRVAYAYDLPVTLDDADALDQALEGCPVRTDTGSGPAG